MANIKHMGESSIKKLSSEQPLVGVAIEFEQAAAEEVERLGIAAVLKKRAIRHLAVADLFHAAVAGAENLDDLDKLVKRYGWLSSAAHRQLLAVNELEKKNDDDILDMVLGGEDGEDRSSN